MSDELFSFFDSVEAVPEDPILSLPILFAQDKHPQKVNLGIGCYQTGEGKSYLFEAVRKAEEIIVAKKTPKDYLPIDGDPFFLQKMEDLVLGKSVKGESVFSIQTVGGSGALRIGGEFIAKTVTPVIALSNPTWPNHQLLFSAAGLKFLSYPYYDQKTGTIKFDEMLHALKKLPPGAAVLLQPACHNPTGEDLTKEQWHEVLKVVIEGKLLPFFDNAYQGFKNSPEEDVYPIRLFLEHHVEMLIATSLAKNFGLYGERVGVLMMIFHHEEELKNCRTQMKRLVRSLYSSPPRHGCKIAETILSTPDLKKEWERELVAIKARMDSMRIKLSSLFQKKGDSSYKFLERQKGFFSLLNLTADQVTKLIQEKGIYLPSNSRISVAGLNDHNLSYIVDAIEEVKRHL